MAPGGRKVLPAVAKPKEAADGKAGAGAEIERLRACVGQLEEAMRVEGIDPTGPLGVWSRALGSTVSALAILAEDQAHRVDEKVVAVERAMLAQVERVKVAVDEARALTNHLKVEIEHNKERRKDDNLALAKELGGNIKDTLKTSLLIRERRWNRAQNWTAAMLAASVMMGCTAVGARWNASQRPADPVQEVMDRCVARKVLDEVTRQYYCPVKVVLGET